MDTKICSCCRVEKPTKSFHKSRTRGDGFACYCKQCASQKTKDRYLQNKDLLYLRQKLRNDKIKELVKSKLTPCVDCGESDPLVLDFDHVRGEKKFNISQAIGKVQVALLLEEIAKCDSRCANCHRRKTHRTVWSKCLRRHTHSDACL
jgi:hypothetical protein